MSTPTASKGKALSFWLQRKRHRKRRRRGDTGAMPRSLQDLLTALEPEVFREERARCPITSTQWQGAVGIRIADRSSPRRLDGDGTLLVAVTSSVWAQELSMLSSTVCQRLQVQGHNVRTVRFVVSAVEPARRAHPAACAGCGASRTAARPRQNDHPRPPARAGARQRELLRPVNNSSHTLAISRKDEWAQAVASPPPPTFVGDGTG